MHTCMRTLNHPPTHIPHTTHTHIHTQDGNTPLHTEVHKHRGAGTCSHTQPDSTSAGSFFFEKHEIERLFTPHMQSARFPRLVCLLPCLRPQYIWMTKHNCAPPEQSLAPLSDSIANCLFPPPSPPSHTEILQEFFTWPVPHGLPFGEVTHDTLWCLATLEEY